MCLFVFLVLMIFGCLGCSDSGTATDPGSDVKGDVESNDDSSRGDASSGGESSDGESQITGEGDTKEETVTKEPNYVTVQHILIGFKDAVGFKGRQVPPKATERTQEEAKALADSLLERALKGEDYDNLVKEYTDDSAPGIYKMSNHGATPKPEHRSRTGMVAAFGDTGFPLKIGEIGMAEYDPKTSPFGWHIVKRVE